MALNKPPKEGFALFGPEPAFPDVPYDEWRARTEKVKTLMKKKDVDLLMLTSQNNCRYFTGFTNILWTGAFLQPMVTLIPVDHEPVTIAGEAFRGTVEAQSWIKDIRGQDPQFDVTSAEDLWREIPEVIKELGYNKSRIGLEMGKIGYMWIPRPLNYIQTFMNALSEATFVDGDEVIWGCRMIKSPLEIDRLSRAVAILRQAYLTAIEEYRPGMSERDVANIIICSGYQNGADFVLPGSISCGVRKEGMLDTGHNFDGATINRGDYLWLDMALNYKGYWADNGRVINVGPPPESFKKGCETLLKAFDAGVKMAKPGVKTKDIWKAITKIEEEGGLPINELQGHGTGLDVHEPPLISPSSETVLEPGMTLEMEPVIVHGFRRLGGLGAFQYENLVVITEDGCMPILGLRKDIINTPFPTS